MASVRLLGRTDALADDPQHAIRRLSAVYRAAHLQSVAILLALRRWVSVRETHSGRCHGMARVCAKDAGMFAL